MLLFLVRGAVTVIVLDQLLRIVLVPLVRPGQQHKPPSGPEHIARDARFLENRVL